MLFFCKLRLGNDHPLIADSLDRLGLLFLRQGHNLKGAELIEKALKMRIKLMGKNHPATAYSMYNLAIALKEQKKSDESKSYFNQCIEIIKICCEINSPYKMHSLVELSNTALLNLQAS